MNQNFNLKLNNPCSEKFNQFTKTAVGGFCNSCQKEVVDFSQMTEKEVGHYFTNQKSTVCGNFKATQLKSYTTNIVNNSPTFSLKRVLSFSLLSLGILTMGYAQTEKQSTVVIGKSIKQSVNHILKEYTISGVVSDDNGPLPGASILLQGTAIGTETDFDGKFTFPKKLKKGDVLVISYVGFEAKKITISNSEKKNNYEMNINLKADSCTLLGKVQLQKVYKPKKSLWKKLKL